MKMPNIEKTEINLEKNCILVLKNEALYVYWHQTIQFIF